MSDGQATMLASIAEKTGWRQISGPLFRKYVGLFLAVVCVALLSNGLFEIFCNCLGCLPRSFVRIRRCGENLPGLSVPERWPG